MKEHLFKFDLQLFAEGGENGTQEENTQGTAAGESTPGTPGGAEAAAGGAETGEAGSGKGQPQGLGAAGKNQEALFGKENTELETYDFKSIVPEGMEYDEQQAAAFSTVAREMKLSGEQAQKLAAYGMKYAGQVAEAANQQRIDEINGWAEESRKELGIDFDHVMQQAAAGLEAVEKAVPNIRSALNYTGAGNRIEMIRMLSFIGELTKEDSFRGFGANSGTVQSSLYGKTNFGLY